VNANRHSQSPETAFQECPHCECQIVPLHYLYITQAPAHSPAKCNSLSRSLSYLHTNPHNRSSTHNSQDNTQNASHLTPPNTNYHVQLLPNPNEAATSSSAPCSSILQPLSVAAGLLSRMSQSIPPAEPLQGPTMRTHIVCVHTHLGA
jgi:hypothetical protein